MLKLGIIGTNWITHSFVNAALVSGEYELVAVYSRRLDTSTAFANEYENAEQINLYTDLDEFANSGLDVVYIASPNSLHYEQSKQLLEAGVNVIVEKPAVSTTAELNELINLSEDKELFYFEAARHIHEDNFQRVASFLRKRDDILGANLTFMKYSSRYDAVLRGETPNIFSTEFSGGAMMDLGVYLVYAAVGWFGKPNEVFYFNQKLPTGVDGLGTMIFRYNGFDVTMSTGKNADSYLPSEIYLSDSTLCMDSVNSISEIVQKKREDGSVVNVDFGTEVSKVPMLEEAISFAQVIQQPRSVEQQKKYQDWIQLARDVHELMGQMRRDSGIVFAADSKEIRG